MWKQTRTAIFLVAGLCACSAPGGVEPGRRILFSGGLTAIDGQAVRSSVGIQIWAKSDSIQPAAYRITTGCELAGISEDGRQFSGMENLSACTDADIALVRRLMPILSDRSSLTLKADTSAEFRTANNVVIFTSSR